MKRFLSIFLAIVMIVAMMPAVEVTVFATDEFTEGGYTYTVDGDYFAKIVRADVSGEAIIPSSLGGYVVTSIGDYAFYYCTNLTSITIPDSVTSIGDYAFAGCSGLTSITIPDSVTSIGDYAFYGTAYYNNSANWENNVLYIGNHLIVAKTSASGDYIIKSGTKYIADRAFEYCDRLTSITIPDSVTSIGDEAFRYCKSLASATIGEGVTSIGNSTFYGCSGLTSIIIPGSVTSIGDEAFLECRSLKSINVTEGNENYCSVDGVLFNKNKTTLITYPAGKTASTYTIPDSVTSIGDSAFDGCFDLTCITPCGSFASLYCQQNKIEFDIIHNVVTDAAVLPTCTGTGLTEGSHCSVCETVLVEQEIVPATGHSYNDGVITTEPTCTKSGVKTFTCKSCSDSYTEVISATGVHNYENFVCTGCGKYLETDHSYSNNQNLTWNLTEENATCVAITFSDLTKTESNYDYIYIYDSKGNQFGKYSGSALAGKRIVVAGDSVKIKFTSDGSSVYYGFAITNIEIFYEHTPAVDPGLFPTCTETGLTEGSHCAECGTILVEQNTVPVLPHTPIVDAAVAPTCTATGLTEGSHCSVCRTVIVGQKVVPALGHKPVTDIAVAPTCTETGLTEGSHCSTCGEILVAQQVVEALGHTVVVDPAVAPTVSEPGLTEGYHCSTCGFVFKAQEEVRPLGNTLVMDSEKVLAGYDDTLVFETEGDTVTYQWYASNSETGSPAVIVRGATESTFSPMDYYGGGNEAKYKYFYCVATAQTNGAQVKTTSPVATNAFALIEETDYSVIDYESMTIYSDSLDNLNSYDDIVSIGTTTGLNATVTPSYNYGSTNAYGTGSTVTLKGSGAGKTTFKIVIYGDTNGDGVVDVLDCVDVQRTSTGRQTLEGVYNAAGDINGDGVIDVMDYSEVVNKALS